MYRWGKCYCVTSVQYLLCLGEKMVLGLLSRSRSLSRSFWLLGESAASGFFSFLKRSRPVRMMCSSILRWRFMSDSTLSSLASLFTDERADDPAGAKQVQCITETRIGGKINTWLWKKKYIEVFCDNSTNEKVHVKNLHKKAMRFRSLASSGYGINTLEQLSIIYKPWW